jgi:hypothetical protein
MLSVPKYTGKNLGYTMIYTVTTTNPEELLASLNDTISKLGCIPVSSKLTPKYTNIWSCIAKWYNQFDFTTSIYNKDEKLVVVFSSYHSMNTFMDYNMLEQRVVVNCPYIDSSEIFILDEKEKCELYPVPSIHTHHPHSIDSMRDLVSIINTCYNPNICEEKARELAKCCDGSSEYHTTNQDIILKYCSHTIEEMLNSTKSMIVVVCGQALIQILLNSNNDIIKDKFGDEIYEPFHDEDLVDAKRIAKCLYE